MNYRKLACNKDIIAIGGCGSIADLKNKIKFCFECNQFITCQSSQVYFDDIKKQQNNLISLANINK